jgi:hypothetical protein
MRVVESHDLNGECFLKVEVRRWSWRQMRFLAEERVFHALGPHTIWRDIDTGERASIFIQAELDDLWLTARAKEIFARHAPKKASGT